MKKKRDVISTQTEKWLKKWLESLGYTVSYRREKNSDFEYNPGYHNVYTVRWNKD